MQQEFQGLQTMEAWDRLAKIAQEQIKQRSQVILHTYATPENMGELNFLKGEISGIELFLKLPQIILEQAEKSGSQDDGDE